MDQLIILFVALIVGYQLKKLPIPTIVLNKLLLVVVILILLVMGYEFGSNATDLWVQLLQIGKQVLVFGGLIFAFNMVATMLVLRKHNLALRHPDHAVVEANYWQFALESGKYLVMIAAGVFLGVLLHKPLSNISTIINWLLIVLLFIIGHQMRKSGVSLKEVIFNKIGFQLALLILISSLIAGLIAAFILSMPYQDGLVLSSGFGWYTLSSILMGQLVSQDYGTSAFFIDFSRELVAIIFLPSLGRFIPLSMVGYCGGTAMDFSLPIIKQNLDEKCVVLAISSGMLLSCAVPILIPLFAKI